MSHKYSIKYKIEEGLFRKDDINSSEFGGCDAMIIHSLMFPEDGSRGEIIFGIGQYGKDLENIEFFKSWSGMAKNISEMTDIPMWQRMMATRVFQDVKHIIAGTGWKKELAVSKVDIKGKIEL